MSCCRGRARTNVNSGRTDAPACKILEQGGANLRFWVMNVQGTHKLCIRSDRGDYVDVVSFISMHQCNGPTAQLVVSNLNRVISAMAKSPGAFRSNNSTGVSLVKLLRTADTVLGSGRPANARRLHPFSARK